MRILLTSLFASAAFLTSAYGADRPSTSATLQDFVGQYTLSDGRILSVIQRHHQLVAQVEGVAPVTLGPVGPARFASMDRQLELAFDQRPNGNVAGVILMTPVKN